jgi:hypothetical protein
MTGLNIALAVGFEAIVPDELLPVGLPVDDLGRQAVMKGAQEAFEAGGEGALKRFLRGTLGDHADKVSVSILTKIHVYLMGLYR